ncbi:MAG: LAGLIDADG family homing endonuclease [Candidatus Woesearchaeota archaeon]
MRITKKLAELCGIIVGDGCITYYKKNGDYKVEIFGDYKELEYHSYIKTLFKEIFNKEPKTKLNKDGISLCLHSKEVLDKLIGLGIPIGKKKDVIRIPPKIMSNKGLTKCFIRGLADTDFSVCFKKGGRIKNSYPRITVEMHSKKLIKDIKLSLESLGITCYYYERTRNTPFGIFQSYSLDINGNKKFEKWMRLIGFKNKKHLSKIEFWKKNGYYQKNCS